MDIYQGTLFGQMSLFGDGDGAPAAAPVDCPKCPAGNLGAYAGRHAAEHARLERRHAEAAAADAALDAKYGRSEVGRRLDARRESRPAGRSRRSYVDRLTMRTDAPCVWCDRTGQDVIERTPARGAVGARYECVNGRRCMKERTIQAIAARDLRAAQLAQQDA